MHHCLRPMASAIMVLAVASSLEPVLWRPVSGQPSPSSANNDMVILSDGGPTVDTSHTPSGQFYLVDSGPSSPDSQRLVAAGLEGLDYIPAGVMTSVGVGVGGRSATSTQSDSNNNNNNQLFIDNNDNNDNSSSSNNNNNNNNNNNDRMRQQQQDVDNWLDTSQLTLILPIDGPIQTDMANIDDNRAAQLAGQAIARNMALATNRQQRLLAKKRMLHAYYHTTNGQQQHRDNENQNQSQNDNQRIANQRQSGLPATNETGGGATIDTMAGGANQGADTSIKRPELVLASMLALGASEQRQRRKPFWGLPWSRPKSHYAEMLAQDWAALQPARYRSLVGPLGRTSMSVQTRSYTGSPDSPWKRVENTRWNKLRGMWGKRSLGAPLALREGGRDTDEGIRKGEQATSSREHEQYVMQPQQTLLSLSA